MYDLRRLFLAPLLRCWLMVKRLELDIQPAPLDQPVATASGSDPIAVLLFGSGPAVGRGVLTNELALPGALARALRERTGLGVTVELAAEKWLLVSEAERRLKEHELDRYDYVVLSIGSDDALTLTSLALWERTLGRILESTVRGAKPTTAVVILGVQPIQHMPFFTGVFGRLAGHHAERMNAISARLVADDARSRFVPAVPVNALGKDRFRDPDGYRRIARSVANSMVQESL